MLYDATGHRAFQYNAKEMGGLRANSNADATVQAVDLFLKPAPAVNQEDEAHPTLSPQPIFDRVLPSLGGDILEQAKEVVEQQQDDDFDQIVIDDDNRVDNGTDVDDDQVEQNDHDNDRVDIVDDDAVEVDESAQPGPLEADKDGVDNNGIGDTENDGPEDSKMTKTPPKYGTIQGGIDGPPYLPKDIEELGGDDVALAPKQMRDPVVVPAVRPKEEDVEKKDTTPSDENEALSSAPVIMPPPPKADPEEGKDFSVTTMEPIKEATPLSNKAKDAIEKVVGTEESHPGIIHVPQMSEGKDEVQKEDIGQEDKIEFEFDGNSEGNKDEAKVEETTMNDDADDNVREESADVVVEIVASEIEAEESGDGDDDTADDDRTERDDDNVDDDDAVDDADDDDRVPIPEDKPVVESVSLKKRKPNDETKEPYLPDDSDTALCGEKSSISALRCKTSALIRYHTVGLMFGASLILAFFCYRRKRRLGGRRSRRLDKSHEYARIIQEYDALLEGNFDDDISYNDDNETMSTWSGRGVGGLEMQNYHSDDRLGVHELNG